MPDIDSIIALLPVDGRVFYFACSPVPWAGGEQDLSRENFARGYGLQLEPSREVMAEFASSLSLLGGMRAPDLARFAREGADPLIGVRSFSRSCRDIQSGEGGISPVGPEGGFVI